jgi:hypothetical protein
MLDRRAILCAMAGPQARQMKHLQEIALGVICSLALCATLKAATLVSTNEYASIAARNVFGLSPPQTPVTARRPEPVEIITPNGIALMSGQKEVLFKVSVASQEKAYILHEGQVEDGIKVLKIDEKTGFVTFNNHGEIQGIPLAVVSDLNISGHIFIGNHLRHYETAGN